MRRRRRGEAGAKRRRGPALSHAELTSVDVPAIDAQVVVARDHGLVRGIGPTALAANIVNGVVGAGIFTLPASVALLSGAAAPAAYIICAVVMAGIVICFAEAGSRVPTSGGAYGTVEAAFGPAAGYVTGILLLLSDVLANGGVAAALADMAGAAVPAFGGTVGRIGVIAAIYVLIAGVNLAGVRSAARVITVATVAKMLPLLLFLGLGVLSLGMAAPHGPPMAPVTAAGFGQSLILTLFAFSGMESALCVSGEVRNPARTLPWALILAMLFILGLYVTVQLTAQHLLGSGLAQAAAPLAQGAARFGRVPAAILFGGAAISMLVWLCNDMLGTPRLLFAFGRDGRLPAWFGQLSHGTRVPRNAIVVYAGAAFFLAASGTFLKLVVLSTLAVVGVYALACAAAFVLHRKHVALAGTPMNLSILPAAAGVGLLGMVAMVASAQWPDVAGLAAVIVGSLAVFVVIRPRAAN